MTKENEGSPLQEGQAKGSNIDFIHPTTTVEEFGQLNYSSLKLLDIREFLSVKGGSEAATEHISKFIADIRQEFSQSGNIMILNDNTSTLTPSQRNQLIIRGAALVIPPDESGDTSIDEMITYFKDKYAEDSFMSDKSEQHSFADVARQQELARQQWLTNQNETEMNEQTEYCPQ